VQVIDEVRSHCLANKNRATRRGNKTRNPNENRTF
jgi:hypothetical protein